MARVYITLEPLAADIRIHLVKSRSHADLLVCLVTTVKKTEGDALWCYVSTRSNATVKICFVDGAGSADLLVCFVEAPGAARWRRKHKLQGRLS